MSEPTWGDAWRTVRATWRRRGFTAAMRFVRERLASTEPAYPLESANQRLLFAVDLDAVKAEAAESMRRTGASLSASNVEESYPDVLEYGGRFMRYAFLPASDESKGLVVLFHGHDAFLHLGPMRPWTHFDLLAPWDTFGLDRKGSWWWGEAGDAFVEPIVQALIQRHREHAAGRPWFCTGGSMGGFGALYHGIKYQCDGIYVACPQVDLRAKVIEAGDAGRRNPYVYLQGDTLESVPDLLGLAEQQDVLPPLFLTQYQFDKVNPFDQHGFPLLAIYNRKRAWYGLRILPAIGHGCYGGDREAEAFFCRIVEKSPPKRFPD